MEKQGEQDWPSLKKQLEAEGRTDLVKVLEDLIQEGQRIETAKVMAQLKSENS
ncbi:hypothetical protein [Roseibium algae]|uniref:Uncharacterized protein n=1 Tax=Roseibium algae TaxID=3123038 RepID=A0ABU8TIA7_9HYPH